MDANEAWRFLANRMDTDRVHLFDTSTNNSLYTITRSGNRFRLRDQTGRFGATLDVEVDEDGFTLKGPWDEKNFGKGVIAKIEIPKNGLSEEGKVRFRARTLCPMYVGEPHELVLHRYLALR